MTRRELIEKVIDYEILGDPMKIYMDRDANDVYFIYLMNSIDDLGDINITESDLENPAAFRTPVELINQATEWRSPDGTEWLPLLDVETNDGKSTKGTSGEPK